MNPLPDNRSRPGIRELLVFSGLAEAYTILSGGTLSKDDLVLIEKAVGLKSHGENKTNGVQEKFSEKQLESALSFLGVKYGSKFLRNDVTKNSKDRREAISLFIKLKRLGFIKETKSGFHKVIGKQEARKRLEEINNDPRGLDEIIGSSRSGWSRDDLLMEAGVHSDVKPYLTHVSNKRILNILSARIRKKDWRNVEAVLEELESRLSDLTNSEFKEFTRELNQIERAEKRLLNNLLKEKSWIKRRLRSIGRRVNGSVQTKGYTRGMGGAEAFFLHVKKYMETGNVGYLDMALSYVNSTSDYPLYQKIVNYLENGEALSIEELARFTRKLQTSEAIVILSILRKNSGYRRFLPLLKNRILVDTRAGRRDSSKTIFTFNRRGGRVDVRRSVFRLARNSHEFLVYRRRARLPGVTLVVDVSGSLRGFSGEVLLYSSILSEMIDHLIVFSDRPLVYKCSKKCRVEEILVSTEFAGNTDIIKALEEAESHTPRTGKIVVVSDFRHNTSERHSLIEHVRTILSEGRRITFIAVGNIDAKTASALEVLGAKVLEPSNPRVLRRVLFRELRSR